MSVGTVMRERRAEVFLASKSHDYTYNGTMALVDLNRVPAQPGTPIRWARR